MKLKPTTVRAGVVLVLGLLIIGFTVWKTAPRKPKRSVASPADARYMHCPECMAEVSFSADKLDNECVFCGYTKGLIGTVESIKKTDAKSPYGKLVAFVLPELVILLTGLWFVLKPRETAGEVMYRYMRCEFCAQKLRYRESQIGNMGACSRCKRAFRFPEGTPKESDLDGKDVYSEIEE